MKTRPHCHVQGAALKVHRSANEAAGRAPRRSSRRPRRQQQLPARVRLPRPLQQHGADALAQVIGAEAVLRRHPLEQLAVARRQRDGRLGVRDELCPVLQAAMRSTGVLYAWSLWAVWSSGLIPAQLLARPSKLRGERLAAAQR